MAATPAQIRANRLNAARSTGPKSVEGKEAARRNALKHGLTGGGVVIPGEDEQEVTIRVAALEAQLVPDGDVLTALLVRQMAIASIRVERAFRHETADSAERMRRAVDVFDDERKACAEAIFSEISLDPVTVRRRLLAATEGIDILLRRLAVLREKAVSTRFIAWDAEEGKELDEILGNKPEQGSRSRVDMLTKGIAYNHWVGLDPADFAELSDEERTHWAVAEVRKIIDDETRNLESIRANLDTTRADRSRSEAAERSLLDLTPQGTALRRYAGAAERTIFKVLGELRLIRNSTPTSETPVAPSPKVLKPMVTETPVRSEVPSELASFCAEPRPRPRPGSQVKDKPVFVDPKSSFASFAVGRAPARPGSAGS